MANEQADIYILARDAPESARLVEQHRLNVQYVIPNGFLAELWPVNYGYIIHPKVLQNLPSNARIADVAAGTGVWALDAAQNLPSASLVAFDLSSSQYPSVQSKNISFTVADAKQPFAESQHGTFDLVHINALQLALLPADWNVVMRNIIQLLKPGGFVQWEEGDNSQARCLRGNPEHRRYTAIPRLLGLWHQVMGERLGDGFRMLPEAATSQGLVEVEVDVMSTDRVPDLRSPLTRMYVTGLFGWAKKAAVFSQQELESLKKEVEAEMDEGAYVRLDTILLTGQKPAVSTW